MHKVNISLLRGKIFEKYKSLAEMARQVNIDTQRFQALMNNQRIWRLGEIEKVAINLNLEINDFVKIFFKTYFIHAE